MTAFCTTLQTVHVLTSTDAPGTIAPGRVQLAVDHADPFDAFLSSVVDGDDAAAVVDLDAADAVALAHALLRAAGVYTPDAVA